MASTEPERGEARADVVVPVVVESDAEVALVLGAVVVRVADEGLQERVKQEELFSTNLREDLGLRD